MPGRASLDPSVRLTTSLPESVRARLDLHLHSEVEGRVPRGAYQDFLVERIYEHFEWKILDLSSYGLPEGYFVRGPEAMINALKEKLDGS